MLRKLAFAFTLIVAVVALPELVLWWRFGDWPELGELREVQRERVRRNPATQSVALPLGPGSTAVELMCSAGSHAYCWLRAAGPHDEALLYIQLAHGLVGSPRVWVEPASNQPARILTYQPIMLDPHEEIHQGFYLWTYDGRTYQPTKVYVNPIALWLRHPIPLSD